MIIHSFHATKKDAKKEAKLLKKQGFDTTIIPGDKSLSKEMSFFVSSEEKVKESFEEKYKSVSKKFFPEETKSNKPKETIEEKMERINKNLFPES